MDLSTIRDAMTNLVNLEIRTIVGDFSEINGKIEPAVDAKTITTRINLLGGDITTAFTEDFLDEPLDAVRDFHKRNEEHAQQIVQGNINALKELAQLMLVLDKAEQRSRAINANNIQAAAKG